MRSDGNGFSPPVPHGLPVALEKGRAQGVLGFPSALRGDGAELLRLVVALSFYQSPVVGAKLGGDAAAHPVFCLSSFVLPCHMYALLAHTPLAARRPTTDTTASGGALGTPAHDSPCPSDVVGLRGRIPNVCLLSRIISRRCADSWLAKKKVDGPLQKKGLSSC